MSTKQLTFTKAANALMAKVSGLKDARGKAQQEHYYLVMKIQEAAKIAEGHGVTERNGALSRYHGLLRSVWATAKAAVELSTSDTDSPTQRVLLFEAGHKVIAGSLSSGLHQEGSRVAGLKDAVEAKKL